MQILNRTLSALLVVVMIVALFPAVAFAETEAQESYTHLGTVDFSQYTFTNYVDSTKALSTDFTYSTVEGDSCALAVKGVGTKAAGTASGFAFGNHTVDITKVYTMTYKVWMASGTNTTSGDDKGVYIGIGGVSNSNSKYVTFAPNVTDNKGNLEAPAVGREELKMATVNTVQCLVLILNTLPRPSAVMLIIPSVLPMMVRMVKLLRIC